MKLESVILVSNHYCKKTEYKVVSKRGSEKCELRVGDIKTKNVQEN